MIALVILVAQLAEPALAQHDYARARDLLEREVAAHPSDARLRSELAEALAHLGYTASAQKEARKAFAGAGELPARDKQWIEARYRMLAGQTEQAVALLRELHTAGDLDAGLALVETLARAGQTSQAVAVVAELRKRSDDARVDLAEALATGDMQVQRRVATRAAARGQAIGARGIVAEARSMEAVACAFMGDFDRAIAAAEEARRLYGELRNRHGLAEALFPLAVATVLRDDDFAHAITLFEQQRAIFHELGDRASEAGKLGDLAFAHLDLGEPKAARQFVARMRAMHEPAAEAQLGMLEAWALLEEGEVAQARARTEALLAEARKNGDSGLQLSYVLARALVEQGELAAARTELERAEKLAEQTAFRPDAIELRALLARVLVEQGQPADGEKVAREALTALSSMHMTAAEAAVQAALAHALIAQHKLAEARSAVDRLRALADRNGSRHDRAQAAVLGARLAVASGTPDAAVAEVQMATRSVDRAGLRSAGFELRLAAAELDRRQLASVRTDAEKHGFLLVARKAAALTH